MNLNATLFVQCIVFLIFSLFTMRFVWPPIMKALDERAKKIAEGLEFAQKAETELVAVREKAEDILEASKRDAQDLYTQKTQEAQKILDEARAHSAHLLTQAKLEAKQVAYLAMAESKEDIRKESIRIAFLLAEKLLEKNVDTKEHSSFLKRLAKEL